MPIRDKEERVEFFLERARELVQRHEIQKSSRPQYIEAQRVGHLFSLVAVKIFGAALGQDAYIEFRDWALERKIGCLPLTDVEYKRGKKVEAPYHNPSKRVYDHLSFVKYITLLEEILAPKRTPLTRRDPVTSL